MPLNPILVKRATAIFRRSDFLTNGLLGKVWLELLLVLIVLLVAAALWRDAHTNLEPQLVAKPGGILPFHVIQLADLRLEHQETTVPSTKGAKDLIGRYAFTYLPSGKPVNPSQLSQGARLSKELEGRVLIQLNVRPTQVFNGMKPPFRASLLASPAERGTTVLFQKDVLVLDLQPSTDGSRAVVALSASDAPGAAGFFSRTDLLLVADSR